MTGEQYKESLKDGRYTYLDGKLYGVAHKRLPTDGCHLYQYIDRRNRLFLGLR